ncbi:hypothetical protein AVEN_128242-1 [Araneus ventricosus]|uniref:Uncharacterized protein n=1 Tax=Araneus ventricosus TaxID=182803 RepID=A0A4Y2A031_ARAVE|nr:hypothetical protein AVEN_128242-1 [Araneus ventricosus]
MAEWSFGKHWQHHVMLVSGANGSEITEAGPQSIGGKSSGLMNPHSPYLKPRSHDQITHRFRPRFALFPVVGTGRFDVAWGIVRASVISRSVAVNSSNIKETRWSHFSFA